MHAGRRARTYLAIGALLLPALVLAQTSLSLPALPGAEMLGFELEPVVGKPGGWFGMPADTVFADELEKHGGKRSLRFERTDASASQFSMIMSGIPVDFAGTAIELRGWLRREGAGVPSLWMRQDSVDSTVQFIDMGAVRQVGEEWGMHSISFRLQSSATSLIIGVRFAGAGKAWADDLELLVDGRPIAEVQRGSRPPSALISDRQFAAGSGLVVEKLAAPQVDALVLTGKVWGFLKYHHPAITAGKLHWDFELLRKLPSVLKSQKTAEVRNLLVEWIDSLGPVAQCKWCARLDSKNLHLAPDLGWISDRKWLGSELSGRLQAIHRNRAQEKQFYVSLAPDIGNPVFENELAYARVRFPDPGFQILAIFRFWNMIEYWFAYRDLVDEDWDVVLRDTLVRAAAPLDHTAFQRELMRFVARADDGHANLLDQPAVRQPAGECQLPVSLRYLEGQFVVEALLADDAAAHMFRAGDVMVELDGRDVTGIANEVRDFYGASNESARMNAIAVNLTRGRCGAVPVLVRRAAGVQFEARRVATATLRLDDTTRNDRAGATLQMLSPDVAYLKLSSVQAGDVRGYIERAADAKALIVDIRNYPSAYVVYALGNLLIERATPFAAISIASLSNPGAFHFRARTVLHPEKPRFGGRVLILVDETSVSMSEFTAMALRATPRAQIVGAQTAGADGDVSRIPMPGGFNAAISGIGIFYPDRRRTQQVGVALDVECRNTIAGLREGRDETLDCALRELARHP
jgi:C-terminal processing protease CtpA/Prc